MAFVLRAKGGHTSARSRGLCAAGRWGKDKMGSVTQAKWQDLDGWNSRHFEGRWATL